MSAVLSLLWMPLSAEAVDWYLESPDVAARSDAARVEEVAVRDGFDARVVRRFVDGAGWRYLVRVDGFADGGSAGAAARQLAEAARVPLAVLQLEGERVMRIDVARPPGVPAPPEPADVGPILAAIARAHGTGAETLEKLEQSSVLLRYRRHLADGRAVRHVWARGPRGTYLEIAPEQGSDGIRASRTRLVAGKATLSLDGGPWLAQDAAKSAAALDTFGPQEVLALLLSVATVLEDRPEFGRMTLVEGGEGSKVQLRYGGDATTGAIDLELDEARRIRRVVFDEGVVIRTLTDYRPVPGLQGSVVPWRITTTRGERVDRIELEAFEVGAELPDAWFVSGG